MEKILVIGDVVGIYPIIPNKDGSDALEKIAWLQNFTKQFGDAIGTKFTPTCTSIFMIHFEIESF